MHSNNLPINKTTRFMELNKRIKKRFNLKLKSKNFPGELIRPKNIINLSKCLKILIQISVK